MEKTLLGEIASYIEEVFSRESCYVIVKIDLKRIQAVFLEIDIFTVRDAILATPKLKLKPGVSNCCAWLPVGLS